MIYKYKLSSVNYIDYQFYLAFHNKNMQKRSIKLSMSLIAILSLLTIILNGVGLVSIFIIILLIIMLLIFFPKLYWNIVLKKIENLINNSKLKFSGIILEIGDCISIESSDKRITINKSDIERIINLKNTCVIIYRFKDNTESLLIPFKEIEEEYEEFVRKIGKEKFYV